MPRFSEKAYRRHVWVAMAVYVGCMLVLWPQRLAVTGTPAKVVLALLPVLPMLYLIGAMMRRIRDSDELEQRTHLVALGVATMVVGALSLGGGFLAAAQVLTLDGTILIWVFPVLMASYGMTRWWVARRYGMDGLCEASGVPTFARLLLVAAALGLGAFLFRRVLGDDISLLYGLALGLGLASALGAGMHWLSGRRRDGGAP